MQRILLFNQDEYNKMLSRLRNTNIHNDNNNNRQVFPSGNNKTNQNHNIEISPTYRHLDNIIK